MKNQRLLALQNEMKQEQIDVCLICSTDPHNSEYISDHFKYRDYLTGFTGSAATVVVTTEEAFLWTDGRYFLQAAAQLADSGVQLQKSGEKGVPTPEEFVSSYLKEGMVLGINGSCVSAAEGKSLAEIAAKKKAVLKADFDYAARLWQDRPAKPARPIFLLEERYAGQSAAEKLQQLKEALQLSAKDAYFLSALDSIAWLLNLRGSDIDYNPVFYSYFYMEPDRSVLFVNPAQLSEDLKAYLAALPVEICDYDAVCTFFTKQYEKIYCDENSINYAVCSYLKEKGELVFIDDPVSLQKAVKNKTEIENLRHANCLDGAAMVRFLRWIEEAAKTGNLDEYQAGQTLDSIRAKSDDFLEISFSTICGYQENGAIIHYSAEKESAKPIAATGTLLVDSGGQYLYGTTDVTRTFSLGGEVSEAFKNDFTLVLKGTLHLQNAVFPEGCSGVNLDILAREALWQAHKDYNHGTGHGIGYCLNVHEGPVNINKRIPKNGVCVLRPGMITSDEPGIYIENAYGIRTENMLLCKKICENAFGTFLGFEPLTYVPIDLRCINPSLLNEQEKIWLNDYHKLVYEKLSPLLNEEEKDWLKENTKAVL